ncbi:MULTISPECIES: bifunctional diguanylate cyclase/phosphodiesterase [unclassified Thermosipho (in: thermotogales)]|uniref:sensor domain-containing protein n=1 Tax=unclassified Thermosipho (in: thermotogales) TaxID=2676525 RepID=UPI000985A9EE|nr:MULTISPECIES: bifunctional diguanylate cyclase/phosphodiesterase [unclassified Thermosipho (in: thermotogales)]MBT1247730.1 diguanylate cyclase [Thermosipho sp. 1244]OOC46791.1 diguanylate cyclase [Thermosipho sp. 1223]
MISVVLTINIVFVIYLLERKLYRLSKVFIHVVSILFILTFLEALKFKTNNLYIQYLEDIIGLTLIPAFYVFSKDINGEKTNIKERILISIPIFLLNIPNLFLFGKSDILLENRIFFMLLVIYSAIILFLSFSNILKANIKKSIKYSIILISSTLFFYISLEVLFFSRNTLRILLFISLSFFIIMSILIRRSWLNILDELKDELLMSFSDGIIVLDNQGYVLDLNKTASKILNLNFNNIINKKLEEDFNNDEVIFKNNTYYIVKKLSFKNGIVYLFRNITKEMEYSKKHTIADKLFSTLFKNIPDAVAIITPKGKIIECNRQFTNLFKLKRLENIESIVPSYLKSESKLIILEVLKNGYATYETIRKAKDGKSIFVKIRAVKFEIDDKVFLYTIYTDISKEKMLSSKLSNLLEKDPLTDTFNKTYIVKQMGNLSSLLYHSLILIDIKGFKWINSIKGHKFGDQLLREVSNTLKEFTKKEGLDVIISRAQNDEFWFLIKDLDIDPINALEKTKKIIAKLKKDFSTLEQDFFIGSYVFKNSEDLEEIIRKATLSLSKAKESDKEVIYSKEIEDQIQKEIKKENLIKIAIRNQEFIPFLQPISTEDRKIIGAEVLIRWKKDGKIIPPSEFLNFLEKSGKITDISLQIFEKVMDFLKKNPKLKFIDINISPVQIKEQDFPINYLKIMEKYNIPSQKIVFEITENLFLSYDDTVKENISRLKAEGIKLCLDDFGTGYSSLSYLRNLPFDILKIDREFVKNIDDEKNINLLKAIYSICETFNLIAIPEGVENARQLEILSMIGFKLFQGYYFGKPQSLSEFSKLIN